MMKRTNGHRTVLALWLALGVLLAAALAPAADAQEGTYACILPDGTNVPVMLDTSLNNIAVARRSKSGQRSIVVNPDALKLFQPATRWFWMAHECAHQQLGHVLGNYGPDREQEADCHAAKELVKTGQFDGADFKAIQDDISLVSGDDKAYLAGPERAAAILKCALAAAQGAANDNQAPRSIQQPALQQVR